MLTHVFLPYTLESQNTALAINFLMTLIGLELSEIREWFASLTQKAQPVCGSWALKKRKQNQRRKRTLKAWPLAKVKCSLSKTLSRPPWENKGSEQGADLELQWWNVLSPDSTNWFNYFESNFRENQLHLTCLCWTIFWTKRLVDDWYTRGIQVSSGCLLMLMATTRMLRRSAKRRKFTLSAMKRRPPNTGLLWHWGPKRDTRIALLDLHFTEEDLKPQRPRPRGQWVAQAPSCPHADPEPAQSSQTNALRTC